MFSLVIPLVEDEDDTVRNNAVFALGEIAFYGKESVYKLVFKFSYALFIFSLGGVALVFSCLTCAIKIIKVLRGYVDMLH